MSLTAHGGTLSPSKRQKMTPAEPGTDVSSPKLTTVEEDDEDEEEEGAATFEEASMPTAIPPHPLRIKPSGNAYISASNLRDTSGLFAVCPDELIIELLGYLDATSLTLLGATSKAFYAFSRHEELWKTLLIEYVYPSLNLQTSSQVSTLAMPNRYS